MFYSNSIKQTIHIIAIAKVLYYLKVNRSLSASSCALVFCNHHPANSTHLIFMLIILLQILLAPGCVFVHLIPLQMENEVLN